MARLKILYYIMKNAYRIDVNSCGLTPEHEPLAHWGGINPELGEVGSNTWHLEHDGKPLSIVAGEFHPQRYPKEQ